jgi:hypothetical protein
LRRAGEINFAEGLQTKANPRQHCSALFHDLDDTLQVFFRIDTNAVVRRLADMDWYAVFQETKLLESFTFLERRFG